jgi:beta-galactosidase
MLEDDKLYVRDHHDFVDLDHLSATWHLVQESGNTEPIKFSLPRIAPGEEVTIDLPCGPSVFHEDTWLSIHFNL